jgi:4-amino-4-deoxy-L-arabinose transferase
MSARKTLYLLLLLFAGYLAVYVIPLGFRPLVMPDETRYAEIPREMLVSGNFIVPRLAGVRYFEKPVMGHWINAFFINTAGSNAFAVRISSALSAAFSALLVSLLLLRFGDKERRSSAALAPAVFLTGFGVFMIGIYSCLDGMFAMFLTATLVSFFAAYRESGRRQRLFLLLTGLFCGCAFLTKGFVAFAFTGVVVTPFLLWECQWKKLFTMAWWPLAAVLAVSAPWCIAVHLHEPDFWHYFVVIEHLHRFSSSDAQHAEPVWYYIPMLLEGMVPWLFILPAAIRGLAAEDSEKHLPEFGDFNALVEKHAGENRIVLILKQNTYNQYASLLAKPLSTSAENGFIFVRY